MSSSGSASRIAARTSDGAMVSTKARKPSGVGRRVVPVVPDHRQDPPVLLREQHQAGGPARLGTDGDELLAEQGVRAQTQVSGGVLQLDRELLLRRLLVADRRQPVRHAAAAPGGIQDQVGIEGLLGVGGMRQHPHPGNPVPGRRRGDQPDGLAPVQDLDSGQRLDPGANVAFQEGPAGLAHEGLCGTALEAKAMATRGKAQFPEVPDHRSAPSDQVIEQSREELVEDLCASGHQHMGVPALGDTLPILGLVRECVAVHHRDPPVGVGQHPGGEEPGHAGP
jgi:hypothetical protein